MELIYLYQRLVNKNNCAPKFMSIDCFKNMLYKISNREIKIGRQRLWNCPFYIFLLKTEDVGIDAKALKGGYMK